MPLNAIEQYLLELINRGRLDPAAEAARYGVALNAGLAAGTIDTSSKQVLAPNAQLESAAAAHSSWMLNTDVFSHTGASGTSPGARAAQQGYSWGMVGENIATLGTSASTINLVDAINSHHAGLYRSEGHRANTMNEGYREIGLAQEQGDFTYSGAGTYTSSMLTELFGTSGGQSFLTGVAFTDRDGDGYYSIGEGRGDMELRVGGEIGQSSAAGGYAIGLDPARDLAVTGTIGDRSFALTVDLSRGNVKLDVVGLDLLLASGSVDLKYGINNVRLLGVNNLDAVGSASDDGITGNRGDNVLSGLRGDDTLAPGAGDDMLTGGRGRDVLQGGAGADVLAGGIGRDRLAGGADDDRLTGGAGADRLWGGDGADDFVFGANCGRDVVRDFAAGQGDALWLNDNLWAGNLTATDIVTRFAAVVAGDVVLDFGAGAVVVLDGVASLSVLAASIEVF